MKIIQDIETIKEPFKSAVITIGNFDGVHIGHQALFHEVIELAEAMDGTAVAMTFDPHPIRVITRNGHPPLITLYEQKQELIEKSGIDVLICIPFTMDFAALSARTFAPQFDQPFDFIGLNRSLIDTTIPEDRPRLIAFDPCFIPKAGKKTPALAYFWHGCHGRADKGLEVSAFSLVDLEHNTAYALSVQQTPAPVDDRADDETLIDAYLAHLYTVVPYLHPTETHLAVDGQFAKKKWLDGVEAVGLHTIGKLRCDADMRFFYTGPPRAHAHFLLPE